MSILVLGLGNTLLTDEAVGVRVVERLVARHHVPDTVEVVDGGTCGMDLLDQVVGRDIVIIVDAIAASDPPGTVRRVAGHDLQACFQTRMSPHQMGVSDMLAALKLMDGAPSEVVLIGVVPESLALGLEMTATVERAADVALGVLVDELAKRGVEAPARRLAA